MWTLPACVAAADASALHVGASEQPSTCSTGWLRNDKPLAHRAGVQQTRSVQAMEIPLSKKTLTSLQYGG